MTASPETAPAPAPAPEGPLPVLPLRDMTIFPFALVPVIVGQERSVRLIDEAMRGDRTVVAVTQKDTDTQTPGPEALYSVGSIATIQQFFRAPDGTVRLLIQGTERVRLTGFPEADPYLKATIEILPDIPASEVEGEALRRALIELFRAFVAMAERVPDELLQVVESLSDLGQVISFVASTVPIPTTSRQALLEIDALEDRARQLIEMVQHELSIQELGRTITTETQQRLTREQQEAYLREQMRSIQRQLGGEGSDEEEVERLRQQITEAGLPGEARQEAERELNRLASLHPASPDRSMIKSYLDWMVTLPWSTLSGEAIDVERARQILDEDHYDLEKVKDRILEHLSVRKLRQDRAGLVEQAAAGDESSREPILCFVGPPGVGKTSLGHSIARALGRPFTRISLGGVHDESEIRGHRRTYIGAMPGRIIQAVRRAGTRDPLFMLDEIDKVSSDWRGDPSAALLEVLDPAQNYNFMDNYLGVGFDLSKVLFIATANTLDTIPPPLRDRMEIIQLAGYTEEEKLHIAQQYLVERQRRANGLLPDEIAFEDDALRHIIRGYTREAGVRNLEREIGSVARKVAREVAEKGSSHSVVTVEVVETLLGRPRLLEEELERITRPGVVTGLAWTAAGGGTLFVEATAMPSTDEEVVLTGQVGDVMRESALTALSYVRSESARFGIDPAYFERKRVHIHIPAGAVPKDGPSAGVTMVTALASLASGKVVRPELAMTGEITLRGAVLPVGGIKEKVLAAHRAGIRTIILPTQNERDLEDVPEALRNEITFHPVRLADEVLEHALGLKAVEETVAAGAG